MIIILNYSNSFKAYLKIISASLILIFGLFILIKISLLVLYKSYSSIKMLSIFKENHVSDNNIINEINRSNNVNPNVNLPIEIMNKKFNYNEA